jgi:uncharacterized membrane protein
MAEVLNNTQQEFWRPPVANQPAVREMVEVCDGCGTEFMVGSQFCHICGANRQQAVAAPSSRSWAAYLEFHNIKQGLGLSTGSLIAFVIGITCVLGAIAAGLIYSERNVLEWEAVQIYRIQWLLASAVSFVVGILLKKSQK